MYKFLQIIFKFSQFWYFKKIQLVNVNAIPKNEANVIVSNHPSAFMDPIVLATQIKIPTYYLVAQEFMGKPKMANYLANNFNMIPVFRASTRPNEVHKNASTFEECYSILNKKKSLVIYAEGVSETQKWLLPLRSGTSRIVLDTLNKYPNLTHINIIPVALNYQDPHKPRKRLSIEVGEVIKVEQSNKTNKLELTNLIQQNLSDAMHAIPKSEADWMGDILDIQKFKNSNLNFIKNREETKRLVDNLIDAKSKNSTDFSTLMKCWNNLKSGGFNNFGYNKQVSKSGVLLSIILSPLLLIWVLFFLVPFGLTQVLIKIKTHKYSFKGSLLLTFGTLISWLWVLIVLSYVIIKFGVLYGIVLALLLPLSVLFLGVYDLLIDFINRPNSLQKSYLNEITNLVNKINVSS